MNEMANLYKKRTGLDAVIFIGPTDPRHGNRVKISNNVGTFDTEDNFVISLPDLKIMENEPNKKINAILPLIEKFLKGNMRIILEYSNFKLAPDIFYLNLKTIDKITDDDIKEYDNLYKINENKLRLSEELIDKLSNLPETGMCYQIVNIRLKDNSILKNRKIINSEYLLLNTTENLTNSDIENIEII